MHIVREVKDRFFFYTDETDPKDERKIDSQGIKIASSFEKLFGFLGYTTTLFIHGHKISVNRNSLKKYLLRLSGFEDKKGTEKAQKAAFKVFEEKAKQNKSSSSEDIALSRYNFLTQLTYNHFLEQERLNRNALGFRRDIRPSKCPSKSKPKLQELFGRVFERLSKEQERNIRINRYSALPLESQVQKAYEEFIQMLPNSSSNPLKNALNALKQLSDEQKAEFVEKTSEIAQIIKTVEPLIELEEKLSKLVTEVTQLEFSIKTYPERKKLEENFENLLQKTHKELQKLTFKKELKIETLRYNEAIQKLNKLSSELKTLKETILRLEKNEESETAKIEKAFGQLENLIKAEGFSNLKDLGLEALEHQLFQMNQETLNLEEEPTLASLLKQRKELKQELKKLTKASFSLINKVKNSRLIPQKYRKDSSHEATENVKHRPKEDQNASIRTLRSKIEALNLLVNEGKKKKKLIEEEIKRRKKEFLELANNKAKKFGITLKEEKNHYQKILNLFQEALASKKNEISALIQNEKKLLEQRVNLVDFLQKETRRIKDNIELQTPQTLDELKILKKKLINQKKGFEESISVISEKIATEFASYFGKEKTVSAIKNLYINAKYSQLAYKYYLTILNTSNNSFAFQHEYARKKTDFMDRYPDFKSSDSLITSFVQESLALPSFHLHFV